MENKQHIRPHLTKEQRLPKCFKEVEKILRAVKSCRQNYKTILANSKLRGYAHKKVYSMTVNILKHYSYIQKILDKVQLLDKEQYLRKEMASILIYELIFGNGSLPGESKVVKTVQLYENDIFHAHEVLQNKAEISCLVMEINIPRYVRVHTLVTTVSYVIKDLTDFGFHQVIYDKDLSEEKYLELVKNLNKGSFLIDFHFKDILVFEPYENLVSLDLYKKGHIFLQDKSSYIPVHILDPQPGCAVLDACAAPGMKTLHIAAKMKNKGMLIACERDKNRFECLKGMLNSGSVKICKAFCKDFTLIDPFDQAYSTIEYILLDPSCSGSGMVNRLDEVTDTENSKNTDRLMKLAGFQIILLKHSLKFPAVKRVVYSTCSVHEEENEYVVHEALKSFNGTFKLVPVMPEWSHRGSEKYEFGKLCLRTDPKIHLTNGFFVAMFERINYDTEENYQDYSGSSFKKQKKSSKQKENCENITNENYTELSLKQEFSAPHSLTSRHIDNSAGHSLPNISSKNSENADCDLEQNFPSPELFHKKHKKKKREYSDRIIKRECFDKSNESTLEGLTVKRYSNTSFSENDENAIAYVRKDKSKYNEHLSEKQINENSEYIEEFRDVIKLHKKKKKQKKEYIDTEVLQSELNVDEQNMVSKRKHKISKQDCKHLQSELEDDGSTIFRSNDGSVQNKYLSESVEGLTNIVKLHKKKKKKKIEQFDTEVLQSELNQDKQDMVSKQKHKISEQDYDHLQSELKEDGSLQNKHLSESIEGLTGVIKLHKKKKKKKNEHFETEILHIEQEKQNVSKQKHKFSKQDYSHLQVELNDGDGTKFTSKEDYLQNELINDMNSKEFINMKSSHKKKKKKEHLNVDCIQPGHKLKETDISFSNVITDSNNMSANEIPEEISDLTMFHKKKEEKA